MGRLGVISFFNDDAWTAEVRRTYYTACGIVIHEEGPGTHGGTLFRGDGGFQDLPEKSLCSAKRTWPKVADRCEDSS